MLDAGSGKRALRDLGSLPPQAGDVIADKYRVENLVGSGGMGIVVAARHVTLGQRVAIKLLKLSGLDPERQHEACARFLREGQAAAGLSSDHVVRIHDVGTLDSGEPFMVMELLRGDDLAKLLERQGPAPVAVAADYILQACHAVSEAHACGIVHRDLKPSNLFVSLRSDGRATLKVLDFGISKAIGEDAFDGNLTDTRSVVGSPYYMSPEQVRDAKRVDARTDVWSLGMILYELLAGKPAFHAETLPAICAAIAADTPRPVRDSRREVPEALDLLILKCLEKDPDKRFQTVSELVRALAPFAPGPDAAKSAEYTSSKDVMLLSEPFGRRAAADVSTLSHATQESGPPSEVLPSAGEPSLDSLAAPLANAAGSAETLSRLSGSGPRRRQAGGAASATLVSPSSALDPGSAAAAKPGGAKAPWWRGRAPAAALAVFLAASTFWVLRSRQAPKGGDDVALAAQFLLRVESEPSGAAVLDGDRVLGATPFSMALGREALQRAPRRLTLRLDGYDPYTIEQGASAHDMRVLAVLSKTASASPQAASAGALPEPPATSASGVSVPARTVAPALRPRAPLRPAGAANPPNTAAPPDIRLER